jgi:uncharacterized protein (TIRG00374 family)
MFARSSEALRLFSPSRVLVPVLFGLGIVGYVMYQEFARHEWAVGEWSSRIPWSPHALPTLGLGALMLVLRDLGYIWQLRILTDRKLSWLSCFQVVLLWDFFAAVSPSLVGGTAVAVFMLCKEKLSLGRSAAIVFTTVFLDQMFYISIPLLVSLIIPQDDIFAPLKLIPSDLIGTSVYSAFWSAWGGIAAYVTFLILALFIAPSWTHRWLTRLLRLPFMQRWRVRGLHMAHELMIASHDLRNRSTGWWFQVWAATSLAWIGRYLVLNCVLAAFSSAPLGLSDHLLVAGRQAVLWIIMVVSPTPGSAGIAEMGFSWLFTDLIAPGLALTLALIWRLLSYYPYLLIGIPVMSRWILRVYGSDVRRVQEGQG